MCGELARRAEFPQLGSRSIVAMMEIGTFRSTAVGPAGMTAIYKGVPPSHFTSEHLTRFEESVRIRSR
jgi:hypothetical protein